MKKECLRITEVDAPKVGEFYLVKCAVYGKYHSNDKKAIPIIGEIHQDNQFGFATPHCHIDGRFASPDLVNEHGQTNFVLGNLEVGEFCFHGVFLGFEWLEKKCLRETTGIVVPERSVSIFSERYHNWYDGFVGKPCKGKLCPHLGTKMLQKDGMLVCPLHDLRGDINTEVIVSREHYFEQIINAMVSRDTDHGNPIVNN
jgi:hypothetical protein